jgi:hypothetical protein
MRMIAWSGLCAVCSLMNVAGKCFAQAAVDVSSQRSSEPGAQEVELSSESTEIAAPPRRLTGSVNLDITNAYFYRGIIQEDSGLIVQPAAKMNFAAYTGEQGTLSIFALTWNSIHGQKTNATTGDNTGQYWYEADIAVGATFTRGVVSVTGAYVVLASPSNAFDTVEEVNITLGVDDSSWLGEWTMRPSLLLAIEVGDDYSDGTDTQRGTYLELGIAPGPDIEWGERTVALRFPIAVGLSLEDYYEDAQGESDTFGFASAGARVNVPLWKSQGSSALSLNIGGSVLFLGDNTSDYNSGDDVEFVGMVGLQFDF